MSVEMVGHARSLEHVSEIQKGVIFDHNLNSCNAYIYNPPLNQSVFS